MDCILHIGTEKTGTTTLQNFLYSNVEELSSQGVALSQIMGKTNNRVIVAYFRRELDDFAQMAGISNQQEKAKFFDGFEQRVSAEIRTLEKSHEAMVITSEHFQSRLFEPSDIEKLGAFLKRHFNKVTVVCYIREQASLRRSSYSTALKAGVDMQLENYHTGIGENHYFYDFALLLRRWAAVFGEENILPRIFSRADLIDGDICADFTAVALPFVNFSDLKKPVDEDNKTLKYLQARSFQAINRYRPFIMEKGGLDPVNLGLKKAIMSQSRLEEGAISSPLDGEIAERFKSSNKEVADNYFSGRDIFPKKSEIESGDQRSTFSLSEVGDIVEAALDTLLKRYASNILSDAEIILLRDCAAQTNESQLLTNDQAIGLLEIAQRARPDGPVIKALLRDLRSKSH